MKALILLIGFFIYCNNDKVISEASGPKIEQSFLEMTDSPLVKVMQLDEVETTSVSLFEKIRTTIKSNFTTTRFTKSLCRYNKIDAPMLIQATRDTIIIMFLLYVIFHSTLAEATLTYMQATSSYYGQNITYGCENMTAPITRLHIEGNQLVEKSVINEIVEAIQDHHIVENYICRLQDMTKSIMCRYIYQPTSRFGIDNDTRCVICFSTLVDGRVDNGHPYNYNFACNSVSVAGFFLGSNVYYDQTFIDYIMNFYYQ